MAEKRNPYDFVYEKAEITADRGGVLDIREAILELNIYETIEKNFLTGNVIFSDNFNINEFVNWKGTEFFEVEINRPDTDKTFKKKFVITKIQKSRKVQDNAAVYSAQLVEETFYRSYIEVISKVYDGRPHEILPLILKDSKLDLNVEVTSNPAQGRFRYIVPNITSLDAIAEVADLSTDEDGLPYYCYSDFGSKNLTFKSFGEMLEDIIAGNAANTPFTFRAAKTSKQDTISNLDQASRIIEDYKHWNSYDILNQVERGVVGSNYIFLDMNQLHVNPRHHSYPSVFPAIQKHLPPNQKNMSYDSIAFDGLHNKTARVVTHPFLSNTYDQEIFNMHDIDGEVGQIRKMRARAIRSMMSKDPIDVKIPGYHFFPRNYKGNSIGKVIPLLFYNNNIDADLSNSADETIDKKMSGQYLIYNCRHHFNLNRYDVYLTCTKFSDQNSSTVEVEGP